MNSLQLDINTPLSINHLKKARMAWQKMTKSPQTVQQVAAINEIIVSKQYAYFQYYQWIRGFKWGIKKMPKVRRVKRSSAP